MILELIPSSSLWTPCSFKLVAHCQRLLTFGWSFLFQTISIWSSMRFGPKGSCAANGPCQGTVFDAGIQHDTLEKNMDTMDQSLIWPNGTNIALKQHRKSISLAPYASCYFLKSTQLQWLNIWAGRTAHSDAVDHFQASFVARKPRSDSEVFGHQIWVELDTTTCPEGLFKNTINTAT